MAVMSSKSLYITTAHTGSWFTIESIVLLSLPHDFSAFNEISQQPFVLYDVAYALPLFGLPL
jgi:hypothetical protein